jgi:indolepyruvate ferredoxin oxidoreductase
LIQLDDKYKAETGDVIMTGVQALARALLDQARADHAAGLKTAGFVSGYRGSPLGGLDTVLWKMKHQLADASVRFEPGVNEELAATAVWGTQQLALVPNPKVQGVYAMWYGKGPGVDRAGDAIRHGNTSGSTRYGGVLLVFGDDHAGKSSTLAHHSEHTVASFSVPILYPASVQEVLEFSLYGWALSRYSGCWSALKIVNETAEKTAVIHVDPRRHAFLAPIEADGDVHFTPRPYDVAGDDVRLQRRRIPRVHEFVRANAVDGCVFGDKNAEFGVVTAGKSYLDVLESLRLLGIDEDCARSIGLSVYKVGLIFPLEPIGLAAFARGKRELLFIEEKKPFMEPQAASILFNLGASERPSITGKLDDAGKRQLPSDVQLMPEDIAEAIVSRLRRAGRLPERVGHKASALIRLREQKQTSVRTLASRVPYFCAGCPHNTSTKVPDGSVALSGIGCHGMAAWMDRETALSTQMGGEGMNWVGMAGFTETPHVFQNMGDGTFYHSGLLAIRGAVSAHATITFKILVNDAVAMTGGQPVEGQLGVKGIVGSLLAEGVGRIAVVTSGDPAQYKSLHRSTGEVTLHHRESLARVQTEMQSRKGVSAIIYDQACAAELRRRRKRGTASNPDQRVFINPDVCEGCGDCTKQSNCVAIVPLETDWGRKRAIDQSSCNKDFSCLQGFCPAMVTISGAERRQPARATVSRHLLDSLPAPAHQLESGSILVTGIGGTGVITIGAVLCMAAHLEGKGASAFDMTGLAQKGGAVYSHIRVTPTVGEQSASKIGMADASLIIGGDMVASTNDGVLSTIGASTTCVLNTQYVPTATFQANNDMDFHEAALLAQLGQEFSADRMAAFNASHAAVSLIGDMLLSNIMLLGFALQKGWLPVGEDALRNALRMNGEAVESNLLALDLGRLAAGNRAAFDALLPSDEVKLPEKDFAKFLRDRQTFLTSYQNVKYAQRFARLVDEVRAAEARACPDSERLSWAFARTLSQLMAYKDEYEVARLYSSSNFARMLDANFSGDYTLHYHMAPPMLARRDKQDGSPRKMRIGPWLSPLLRVLAALRFLRGTLFDPFGHTKERRMERELIEDLVDTAHTILARLSPDTLAQAVEIVERYGVIRGFGHIKRRNAAQALREIRAMLPVLTG